jgi:hypothetical protein
MKNLTLLNNEWKQKLVVELSDEEQALLFDLDESKREEQQILVERIANESVAPASPEDAAAAQALYDQHKIEGADLMSVDLSLPESTGIINCRLGDEHKQIRF